MPEMITRELYQSPMQAYALGTDISVGYGEMLSNVWQTPQLSSLTVQQARISESAMGGFTDEQRASARDLQDQASRISGAIGTMVPGADRDAAISELQGLNERLADLRAQAESESISEGRLVAPEELNKTYGELVTFDHPATPEEAKMTYEGRKAEVIRQAIIDKGPDGFIAGAAKFGVGFLDVATDPLELAIGFIPVVGPSSRGARLSTRVARGVGEGFVANVMTEPLYYGLSRQQQLDYTMNDALLNIGIGSLLGGALAGAFGRRLATADIVPDPSVHEAAGTALRQFVNDRPIDLTRLKADLRYTTTLARTEDITFQPQPARWLPEQAEQPRPQIIEATTYKTIQQAQEAADKVGGTVVPRPDGEIQVRRPVEGDFTRDPRGEVLTFPNERAATKFIEATRKGVLPEGSVAVPFRGKFAVAHGITPDEAKAIVDVPKGIDTRQPAILPDAATRIDDAVKGVAAYRQMSKGLAKDALTADAPPPRTAIDQDGRGDPDEQIAEATEQLEHYKAQLDEADEDLRAVIKEDLKLAADEQKNKTIAARIGAMCVVKNG